MVGKRKILLGLSFVGLVAMAACFIFRRDIIIMYHLKCRAAIERSIYRHYDEPKQGGFDVERTAIEEHINALIEFGHFQKETFQCPRRLAEGGTNENEFYKLVTNTFNGSGHNDWRYTRDTNNIEVLARGADMPRWKKLIMEFDRP